MERGPWVRTIGRNDRYCRPVDYNGIVVKSNVAADQGGKKAKEEE
jgi:hypothetical protein